MGIAYVPKLWAIPCVDDLDHGRIVLVTLKSDFSAQDFLHELGKASPKTPELKEMISAPVVDLLVAVCFLLPNMTARTSAPLLGKEAFLTYCVHAPRQTRDPHPCTGLI